MESLRIGNVACDYIDPEEFLRLCDNWLSSDTFHHIVTLNPEMVMLASHSKGFANALDHASIRTPDGSGLIWARWYLRSAYWSLLPSLMGFLRQNAIRVTGVDAVLQLSELAQRRNKRVYLLGGTSSQVTKTAKLLQKKFPGLDIAVSPDHAFRRNGPTHILEDIRAKQPAILFVAYGAPNQSVWIDTFGTRFPTVRLAIGVGGAFSMLSEETPRAPRILRRHNLEWTWRLLLEPHRLPRIWQAVVQFPILISRQKRKVGVDSRKATK